MTSLRPAAALAASLVLHAGVLLALLSLVLPAGDPDAVIRLTLLPPGGGGGDGNAPGAGELAGPPAPPAAEPVPQPAPAVPAPERISRAVVAREVQRARPKPPATRVVRRRPPSPPAPAASDPALAALPPAAGAPRTPAGADGSGAGGDGGSGPGRGGGSGAGQGTGAGSGSGAGAGSLRARCLSCPEPSYPRIARIRGWQGTVDVDLHIGPDGTVAEARVARSSGFAALDDAALAVARRSRFQIASAEGIRGRIAYGFRLGN